jgi:serine/threonine protein kinase
VRREIGALRKVHHPNVVTVIWADHTDQGEWFLIMEYIDGECLPQRPSDRTLTRYFDGGAVRT